MNYFSFPFSLYSFCMSLELSLICLVNVVIFLHEEIQYLAALISEPRTLKGRRHVLRIMSKSEIILSTRFAYLLK